MNITEIYITHKITYAKGTEMTGYSEGRRFSGFVLALSGDIDYVMRDGERITLHEGEMMYLPEMSGYSCYTPRRDFEHCTLNFGLCDSKDSTLAEDVKAVLFGKRPVVVKPDFFDEARRLCDRVVGCRESFAEGSEILCRAYLYEVLYMFICEFTKGSGDGVRKSVMPAKSYIDSHYLENIPTALLSEMCAMSETHLRRQFKRAFGMTAGEYALSLRIQRAKALLLTRYYRVSEVSSAVGFEDANYFSRIFKAKVGMTPAAFMKSR